MYTKSQSALVDVDDSVLVFDVETSAPVDISDPTYVDCAKVKWFGAYSFSDEKYYFFDHSELDAVQELIDRHRVIVGYNNKDFDEKVCKNSYNQLSFEYKVSIDLMRVLFNPEKRRSVREGIIKVNGRLLKDVLPNHKLKSVAEVMGLSVQKGDIDYRIFMQDNWSKEQKQEILKYLYYDLRITKELFEFMYKEFLPMKGFMSQEDQDKYNWLRTSMGGYAYKVICHQAGLAEEYAEVDDDDRKKYEGGYVVQPTREEYTGKIVCLDFASAYPHAFFMGNLYSHADADDASAWTGNDLFPVKGRYSVKHQGVIEKVIKSLYELRLQYKRNKDPREYAVKIIINTCYGVSGSPIFKSLYDINTASDCTLMVRQMIKHARHVFEESGYELIYTDTDSVYLLDPFNDEERMLAVKQRIIDEIKSKVPFPAETFNMAIDERIKALWFFKDRSDEFKKKHYVYITEDGKLKMKGIALIKSNASRLSQLVFEKLKPLILEQQSIKFSREFIEGIVKDFIENDLTLVANYYKVKKPQYYAAKSSLHCQIAVAYGEGEHYLVPNHKLGKVGKQKRYCSVEEAAQLELKDLDLSVLWNNELSPFIADYVHPDLLRAMERAQAKYDREKKRSLVEFFKSDLFDKKSVGVDISDEDFLENEQWFALRV